MTELSPEARALIDQARPAEGPSTGQRARLRGALIAQIGVGAALSTGTTVGAATTGGAVAGGTSLLATAVKIVAAVAFAGGLGAGGLAALVHRQPHDTTPVHVPALVAPPPRIDRPAPRLETMTAPSAEPSRAIAPVVPTPSAFDQAPPTTERSAALRSEHGASLEAETQLLRDADGELRAGRPDQALLLLEQHSTSFARGALAEERAVERILALCALGRISEAVAEREIFLRDRPQSLLADRVRASCGGEGRQSSELQ